ncbi:MAG: hypothetical protein HY898_20620 [Deltaproteobacteria bacterium]|nr:hypothetical protein [Deltaproteobacteria bacterium]
MLQPKSWIRLGCMTLACLALSGASRHAKAEPPEQQEPRRANDSTLATLTYGGLATAGVGVVIGSVTGIMALSKTSQLKSDCGGTVCPSSKQDDLNSARNMAGLSTVSFAIALVGAAVGFNAMILWGDAPAKQPPPTTAVQVRPVLGLGSAGLEGSF